MLPGAEELHVRASHEALQRQYRRAPDRTSSLQSSGRRRRSEASGGTARFPDLEGFRARRSGYLGAPATYSGRDFRPNRLNAIPENEYALSEWLRPITSIQ